MDASHCGAIRRLGEGFGMVEVSCLRLLPPMSEKLTVGAVAGDRLYLHPFCLQFWGSF